MTDAKSYYFYEDLYSSIPLGWEDFFEDPIVKNVLLLIEKLIVEKGEGVIAPLPKDLFNAFRYIQPSQVRVVLFGQDPYPGITDEDLPVAMGMSFSVRDGVPIPASLKNIFKEAASTMKKLGKETAMPKTGDLSFWCAQGVLLLNKALTVIVGHPGSHQKGAIGFWDRFLKRVLSYLHSRDKNIVYILLGKESQKLKDTFLSKNAVVVEAGHPSPMANTGNRGFATFLGSDVFTKVNDILVSRGGSYIEWLPIEE